MFMSIALSRLRSAEELRRRRRKLAHPDCPYLYPQAAAPPERRVLLIGPGTAGPAGGSMEALGWLPRPWRCLHRSPARPSSARCRRAPPLCPHDQRRRMTAPASRAEQRSHQHCMCLLLRAPSPLRQALSISCFLNHMGNRHMLHFCF